MKRKKTEHFSETWFFKWILNNQAVVAFFILLLIGLTVFTRHPIYDHYYVAIGYFHAPLLFNKTFGTTCRKNWTKPNYVYLGHLRYPWFALGLGNFDGHS